jgi:hypothetical protein
MTPDRRNFTNFRSNPPTFLIFLVKQLRISMFKPAKSDMNDRRNDNLEILLCFLEAKVAKSSVLESLLVQFCVHHAQTPAPQLVRVHFGHLDASVHRGTPAKAAQQRTSVRSLHRCVFFCGLRITRQVPGGAAAAEEYSHELCNLRNTNVRQVGRLHAVTNCRRLYSLVLELYRDMSNPPLNVPSYDCTPQTCWVEIKAGDIIDLIPSPTWKIRTLFALDILLVFEHFQKY